MAVGWLALELSNSAFIVGLVASAAALPVVLFSMHAGAIVDGGDRLRIVRIAQTALLLEATTLWLLTLTGHINVPTLIVMASIAGLASTLEIPARQAMIVQLVGYEDLQPAIALNSSGFNLARVVGPAVGGIVIHQFGIEWCFGINALSYVAVLWGLYLIKLPSTAISRTREHMISMFQSTTRSAADGLRYMARPGAVRDLLGVVTVNAIFAAPFLTLLPVVARDRLGLNAGGYGSLLAAIGLGGLSGALTVAGPAHTWRRSRTLAVTGVLFPLLILIFAIVKNVAAAHVILFFTGLTMIMFTALSNGTLQGIVEEEYRGRLMALYSLIFIGLSQAVGAFVMGAFASMVGVATAIGGAAVVTILYSAHAMYHSGALRKL